LRFPFPFSGPHFQAGAVKTGEVHRIAIVCPLSPWPSKAQAFLSCWSLSSIYIPSSVEVLREKCFGWCQALWTVTIEPHSILSSVPEECWMENARLKDLDFFDLKWEVDMQWENNGLMLRK
jgi:hypothetical protein